MTEQLVSLTLMYVNITSVNYIIKKHWWLLQNSSQIILSENSPLLSEIWLRANLPICFAFKQFSVFQTEQEDLSDLKTKAVKVPLSFHLPPDLYAPVPDKSSVLYSDFTILKTRIYE